MPYWDHWKASALQRPSGDRAERSLLIEKVNTMSKDTGTSLKALEAKLEALAAQNAKLEAALAAKAKRTMSLRLGQKGNMCIYGLQRYHFSFYRAQIEHILDHVAEIRAFLRANSDTLSSKVED